VSTIPDPGRRTVPRQYRHLVDDAAMFPPGDAPLADAVAAYRRHRSAPYADLVGRFLVSDVRLPDLLALVEPAAAGPLAVGIVVTGGAGALEPAVRRVRRTDALDLRCVEIALRDESEPADNARRVATVTDQLAASGDLDDDVSVYVEPPRLSGEPPGHSWLTALDEVAATDLRLKLRTGGTSPEAFPGSTELATCIEAALDRELAFKCTAGLHHAVRHRDRDTGFEHHGFLNVLLATRASLDGAGTEEVAALLDQDDASTLRERLEEAGPDLLASTRRWFTCFGSCSVREPLEDLRVLDLLPNPSVEGP
jgi:hypothetical protein